MLAEVGIPTVLRSEDNTTYSTRVGDDDVHLFLSGWSADFLDPSEVFNYLFYQGRDDTNYSNPEVDALIARATAITDDAERDALPPDPPDNLGGRTDGAPLLQQGDGAGQAVREGLLPLPGQGVPGADEVRRSGTLAVGREPGGGRLPPPTLLLGKARVDAHGKPRGWEGRPP